MVLIARLSSMVMRLPPGAASASVRANVKTRREARGFFIVPPIVGRGLTTMIGSALAAGKAKSLRMERSGGSRRSAGEPEAECQGLLFAIDRDGHKPGLLVVSDEDHDLVLLNGLLVLLFQRAL